MSSGVQKLLQKLAKNRLSTNLILVVPGLSGWIRLYRILNVSARDFVCGLMAHVSSGRRLSAQLSAGQFKARVNGTCRGQSTL
jgi:hypothetical protein